MRREVFPAASALLLCVAPAFCAQFHTFSVDDQIAGSDLIVTGEIVSVDGTAGDAGSLLGRQAVLAIDEAWKGSPRSDRIVVLSEGGERDGVSLEVDGAARFEPGERVLLFLYSAGEAYRVFGMRHGKLLIEGEGPNAFTIGHPPPGSDGARDHVLISVPLEELRMRVSGGAEDLSR